MFISWWQQSKRLSARTRELALERDGRRCAHCGRTNRDLQVHHIVPRWLGGSDEPDNLITRCGKCHALELGHLDFQAGLAKRWLLWASRRAREVLAYVRHRLGDDSPRLAHVLKTCFGYPSFRPGQREIMLAVLKGKDVVAVMATGAGKGLCFQVPTLCLPGTTVVICPIIALMRDQVRQLQEKGIPATWIDAELPVKEKARRIHLLQQGAYKFFYRAPEGFSADKRFREKASPQPQIQFGIVPDMPETALDALKDRVSLFVVDEAHVGPKWESGFRPDYGRLADFCHKVGRPPVVALTATLEEDAREWLKKSLRLEMPVEFTHDVDRENLWLGVREVVTQEEKTSVLLRLLSRLEGQGIVYVESVSKTEEIAEFLKSQGITAMAYHARLPRRERSYRQDSFHGNHSRLLVATSGSFGMGIDMPCLRFIIHYDIPGSLTDYWQGAGRAGRDGKPAVAILLYQEGEDTLHRQRIDDNYPSKDTYSNVWDAIRIHCGKRPALLPLGSVKSSIRGKAVENVLKRFQSEGWIRYSGKGPPWIVEVVRQAELSRLEDLDPKRHKARADLARMAEYARGPKEGCRRRVILENFGYRGASILSRLGHWRLRTCAKPRLGCCDLCDGLLPARPIEEWVLGLPIAELVRNGLSDQ